MKPLQLFASGGTSAGALDAAIHTALVQLTHEGFVAIVTERVAVAKPIAGDFVARDEQNAAAGLCHGETPRANIDSTPRILMPHSTRNVANIARAQPYRVGANYRFGGLVLRIAACISTMAVIGAVTTTNRVINSS